jgi:lipopolysaccharide/colanic/teichoic acid biosynthesis glycosyltransferase
VIAKNVDSTMAVTAGRGGSRAAPPTVWGCDPVQLHDRFWAHRGVQVVRPGSADEVSERAQLYLLTDERQLATIESGAQLETLYWSSPDLVYVRIHDVRERGGRERVVTDEADRFVRFERLYDKTVPRLTRAAFTPDRHLARAWRDGTLRENAGGNGAVAHAEGNGSGSGSGSGGGSGNGRRADWPGLRRRVPRQSRSTIVTHGSMYDRADDADLARLVKDLTRLWVAPGAMIPRARPLAPQVWADAGVTAVEGAKFAGPVWVGAGRSVTDPTATLIGPVVLWDDPAQRPAVEAIDWPKHRLSDLPTVHRPISGMTINAKRLHGWVKRAFDVVFSLFAIALTIWVYPFVFLAIWAEDGWPVFFAHRRETRGGREFPCLKFRSMYRNAEKMKQELADKNQADGAQFYIERDPRVTRVGRFLRKSRFDELPQFFNVLVGQMSVVGPRPSPFKENQFCPAWREARLSVRPGITGLWQVKRTREAGSDFQEWIKYDIEYVENASFSLDMIIIVRTVVSVIAGILPRRKRAGAAGK